MNYYILDRDNTITNSIVLEDGADPAEFGAIADERIFNIGDIWTPPPTEMELMQKELEEVAKISTALLGPEPNIAAAQQTRRAVQMFAASLPEEQALEVSYIFPAWEVNHKYTTGDIISYGKNSVGDPQLYKIVQDHTSSEEWKPDSVPSLYDAIGLDNSGYPVWSQPSGAHDAYNKGDIVNYNGTLYESLIDGNTWAPDAYPDGWKIYSE